MILRLVRWAAAAFTAAVLVISFTPLANIAAKSLIVEQSLIKSDIVVVLGGGAYKNGVLGKSSNERLIHGLILYRKGLAPKVIFSGGGSINSVSKAFHTAMDWKDPSIGGVTEAGIMHEVAAGLGIPERDLAVDTSSINTYQNLKNVKAYMAKNGLRGCLIVTSPTHMYRASLIAKKLGMDCYPAPVSDYTGFCDSAVCRLTLINEVFHEYASLALYRILGYI